MAATDWLSFDTPFLIFENRFKRKYAAILGNGHCQLLLDWEDRCNIINQ